MFDLHQFVSDCRAALKEDASPMSVREVVARAVSDPAAMLKALGEPTRGEMQVLHRSKDLTVLNLVWAPSMILPPHNHLMWAVIGIYTGREDNIFWRRMPDPGGNTVEAAGARSLGEKDAVPLGRDIIHSVTNPIPRFTAAIHVYGGDFFGVQRSEWNPEDLREEPSDGSKMAQRFEEANARMLRI